MRSQINRREFCAFAGSTLAAVSSACSASSGTEIGNDGRLTVRQRAGVKTNATGRIKLERDSILQVPGIASSATCPLLVMLHGATQNAEDMFEYLGSAHEEAGVAVLAPNARETTWDAIRGSFGADVEFLNRIIGRVFETVAVDPGRVTIGGFSDGASYGLSLGLINGDLFSRVAAFSPGFVIEGPPHGKPRIFISHGTKDHILPINSCGRRVAAGLKASGYDVTFREFDGDHEIPPEVAREGLKWVAAS